MDALGSITTGPGHVILCVAKTGYHTLILFTDADDQIVAKVEYAYPSPGYTIVPMGKKNKKRIWRMTRTPVVWRLDDRVYVPDEEEVATTFDLENVHAAILSSWDVAKAFDDSKDGYNLLTRNCRTFAMEILVAGCGVSAELAHDAATANGFRFGVCTSGKWCPPSCPFQGENPLTIAGDIFSMNSTGLLLNEVQAGFLRLLQAIGHSLTWTSPALALRPKVRDTCASLAALKLSHGRHPDRPKRRPASASSLPDTKE